VSDLRDFIDELRRRGVLRAGFIYAAAAFATLEFADIAFPRLGLPDRAVDVVLWIGLAGFPIALLASWAIEVRAELDRGLTRNWLSARTVTLVALLVGLGVAIGYFGGGVDGSVTPSRSSPEASPRSDASLASKYPSVAVLPFENLSGDPATDPFANGIHDDLVTHISRISSIKTISRTSVLQYRNTTKPIPEIAAELGVTTILEGGVQRAGDRVRINVQLIDAAADEHLWSETYDRELTAPDIFAVQTEIAISVASALRATLSAGEQRRLRSIPTDNLAAVETYFLGRQLLERRSRESLLAALEYFEQVVELDPGYALAYSGLADAHMLLPEYVPETDPLVARAKSEEAAGRALALDPELPEALSSMGWNRLVHYYDWRGAEELLRRALDIQSNNTNALHWLSHVLSWQGQHQEALDYARRAVEVDPNSRLMGRNLSYILMDAADFESSIEMSLLNMERHRDQYEQHGDLWLTLLRTGRPRDASRYLVEWAELTGRNAESARMVGEAFIRHQETGEPQTLPQAVLDGLDLGSEDLGQAYAFLGDAERCLAALEKAYEERSGSRSVLSMKVNPAYDFIRNTPRFRALLGKVGLAD
jgi:adenylate cyclase